MSDHDPRVAGAEATFHHIDELTFTEVKQQRNADGSISGVREKWPLMRQDFLSAYIRADAGMISRRHGHLSNHIVYIIEGGSWFGDRWCPAGTHIWLPLGAAFGPIVAGPDGMTSLQIMMGDWRGWGDAPETFTQACAAHGVEPLPDPPLDFGDWHHDIRDYWAGQPGADVTNPRVEGLEADFWHLDDVEFTPVKRQRNADGSISEVREKWPVMRPDFLSAYIRYDPGMIVRRHGHLGDHLVYVLEGGAWFGDRWCPAGTHIWLPLGAAFGPIVAGPEGTVFLELTMGDFRSWGDRPETLDEARAAHGVTGLPDPELHLDGWFEDKRDFWAGGDGPTDPSGS